LQNNAGHRMMVGVTESDQRVAHAARFCQIFGRSRENEKRFATWLLLNVDISPAHGFADTGAKGLRNRLFGRKSRCQMSSRKFHRHGVGDFPFGEDAAKETVAE